MRKLGIVIAVVVALIIIALLAVPHFLNVNHYRGTVQAELQKRLNRPVSLGNMHLSLLPPAFRVDNVKVGENPAFGNGEFATAQQLYVTAKFWPLLHGNVQISSLDLRRPDIELIHNPQGVWNFETIGQTAAPSQKPAQPTPPQQAPPQPQKQQQPQKSNFELNSLKITDGQIAVTDEQKHQPRAVYDHIDASLKNYAPGKPFSVSVAAHLPGSGNEAVALNGTAGPVNQSNFIQTPFSGTIKLNDVALSGVKKYLNSSSLANMEGVISGTTDINNDNGKLSSRGSLTIRDARVNGVNVGYPISADYRVNDDLSNDVINVEKGDVKLGSTPISISGTLNTKPTPSQIDMRVQAKNVDIADAGRLASAFGVAFSPGMKIAGRATADLRAQGAANKPAMNGTLSANDLIVSGNGVPQPVKVQSVTLALTPQDVRSNPFTASSGGTNVNAQFTLSQYTTNAPNVDATLKTANANVAELISMAHAYGVNAVSGMSGSGTVDLDVHATGPLKNVSAMNFSGNGAIRNASLKPPTFTQPLNVHTADLKFNSNTAVLTNLAASLGSTSATGNMTVHNFSAPNLQFTLSADKIDVGQIQQITSGKPAQQQQRSATDRGSFWDVVPHANAQVIANNADPKSAAPGMLSKITGNGNITANVLQYDQLVINNLRSGVTMGRGIVNLSPITSGLYGGQETGQITANLLTTPMLVTVATKLQNVRANDLLSATTSLKNTLYGLLASSGNLRFSAASSADIARTLNGDLALNLTNGKIAKIDILNQLAAIGKFTGVRKNPQAMTNFAKMGGNFNISNGVAQTNNFQAAIDGGTLAAQGAVDLASQTLNLHMTAVLDKNVTKEVGGTGVGGFMDTALANNRGELVMPVIVTGTFSNPHLAPDLQKIADMKLHNLLPTTDNPVGAAAGLLGGVTGGKGQGSQQGGLGGIVGALTGQQQQQQQQQQQPAAAAQPQPQQKQQQQQQQPENQLNQLLNGVLGGNKNQQQQQNKQPPK
jgi:uncharacterized protein involved in outer membrane biogenesis